MRKKIKIIVPTIIFIFLAFNGVVYAASLFVDPTYKNEIKVCRDVSCANPAPFIIEFNKTNKAPLYLDDNNNLIGQVWGNELGWITFNPINGGGVHLSTAGLLSGSAWSENSGAINFAVTGQEVRINKDTGEVKGWAWAAGPYGGWVKFDCSLDSCLRTIWRGGEVIKNLELGITNETINNNEESVKQESKFLVFVGNAGNTIAGVFQEKTAKVGEYFSGVGERASTAFTTRDYNSFEITAQTFSNLWQRALFIFESDDIKEEKQSGRVVDIIGEDIETRSSNLINNITGGINDKKVILSKSMVIFVEEVNELFSKSIHITRVTYQALYQGSKDLREAAIATVLESVRQ